MSSNRTIGLESPFDSTTAVATRPSFLARWYSNFMKAQIARGERRAAQYMRSLSPGVLQSFGFTTEEIAELRRKGKLPASFWPAQH